MGLYVSLWVSMGRYGSLWVSLGLYVPPQLDCPLAMERIREGGSLWGPMSPYGSL